jgi:hypothetical protein
MQTHEDWIQRFVDRWHDFWDGRGDQEGGLGSDASPSEQNRPKGQRMLDLSSIFLEESP